LIYEPRLDAFDELRRLMLASADTTPPYIAIEQRRGGAREGSVREVR